MSIRAQDLLKINPTSLNTEELTELIDEASELLDQLEKTLTDTTLSAVARGANRLLVEKLRAWLKRAHAQLEESKKEGEQPDAPQSIVVRRKP